MRRFFDGLLTPHPGVLAGAMGVWLAWIGFTALVITPDRLAGLDEAQLRISPIDDPGRVTHQILRLQQRRPDADTVVILGPSSTREALVSTEALAATLPPDVAIHDLSGRGLTWFEDVALLDALADGFRGVVVWTVSPIAACKVDPDLYVRLRDRSGLALGFSSPRRDTELAAAGISVPFTTGVYAWDVRSFLLQRLPRPSSIPAGPYHRHRTRRPSRAQREANARDVAMKLKAFPHALPAGLDLLARGMADVADRADQVSFLLVEQTQDPVGVRQILGEARRRRYRNGIQRVAEAARDAFYIDPNGVLTPDDFADLVHLGGDAGRQRYTEALGRSIALALTSDGRHRGQPLPVEFP